MISRFGEFTSVLAVQLPRLLLPVLTFLSMCLAGCTASKVSVDRPTTEMDSVWDDLSVGTPPLSMLFCIPSNRLMVFSGVRRLGGTDYIAGARTVFPKEPMDIPGSVFRKQSKSLAIGSLRLISLVPSPSASPRPIETGELGIPGAFMTSLSKWAENGAAVVFSTDPIRESLPDAVIFTRHIAPHVRDFAGFAPNSSAEPSPRVQRPAAPVAAPASTTATVASQTGDVAQESPDEDSDDAAPELIAPDAAPVIYPSVNISPRK